jgi:hypothetical protein
MGKSENCWFIITMQLSMLSKIEIHGSKSRWTDKRGIETSTLEKILAIHPSHLLSTPPPLPP